MKLKDLNTREVWDVQNVSKSQQPFAVVLCTVKLEVWIVSFIYYYSFFRWNSKGKVLRGKEKSCRKVTRKASNHGSLFNSMYKKLWDQFCRGSKNWALLKIGENRRIGE